MKSNFCDYSDAYIIVRGNIAATGNDANTRVAFKNCALFTKCITHIDDEHVHNADNLDIVMPTYNLIKYSDNYSDTSWSLWQFKRDKLPVNNNGAPVNVNATNSSCFKYKSSFIEESTVVAGNRVFWKSLEMPLINCKIHPELSWISDCIMSTIANTKFKITNTKLYVPTVTLSSKDNVKY